jgi:hypothetical protein
MAGMSVACGAAVWVRPEAMPAGSMTGKEGGTREQSLRTPLSAFDNGGAIAADTLRRLPSIKSESSVRARGFRHCPHDRQQGGRRGWGLGGEKNC